MPLFTLHYETPLGSRDVPATGAEVREQGAALMPLVAAERVWDIAVLDADGADVTATFSCFA